MHLLPAIPFCLLVCVTAWLVWPMVADPVTRRLGRDRDDDAAIDDPRRAWADLMHGEGKLAGLDRG